ncbi:isochorismatase family protein [Sinomonas terricola]|uniref:isochorismatase family protein n=1 Tax=Sinomonas terricola TaxID=3110330 RepID=UPI003D1865D4
MHAMPFPPLFGQSHPSSSCSSKTLIGIPCWSASGVICRVAAQPWDGGLKYVGEDETRLALPTWWGRRLVVGVFASQGVVATAFEALARDVEFIVVTDALADTSPGLHELAMRQVARSVGQVVYLGDLPQR